MYVLRKVDDGLRLTSRIKRQRDEECCWMPMPHLEFNNYTIALWPHCIHKINTILLFSNCKHLLVVSLL